MDKILISLYEEMLTLRKTILLITYNFLINLLKAKSLIFFIFLFQINQLKYVKFGWSRIVNEKVLKLENRV